MARIVNKVYLLDTLRGGYLIYFPLNMHLCNFIGGIVGSFNLLPLIPSEFLLKGLSVFSSTS